jgi:hypothetical protein
MTAVVICAPVTESCVADADSTGADKIVEEVFMRVSFSVPPTEGLIGARRPVSWLAGRSPCCPCLPGFPVADTDGLAAYSCGGSCGFGGLNPIPHRIPVSSPRHVSLEEPARVEG